jgi:oligopeptide transport system ATP-binding protein
MTHPLFELQNITVQYPKGKKTLTALYKISLKGYKGKTIGIVGESGSGKSTLGKVLLGLQKPTKGSVYIDGKDLASFSTKELRTLRKRVQIIFQDPDSSLNPRMTVKEHLIEAFTTHNLQVSTEALLDLVHLDPLLINRYPFELSGGQKQRVAIARALAVQPELLVLDEPLSSLDMSCRKEIMMLLQELKQKLGLSMVFITHDLPSLKYIADSVAVLYLGSIVEHLPIEALFTNPLHPYTKALLSAAPIADPIKEKERQRIILIGDIPSPFALPSGCPFHTRCPMAQAICSTQRSSLEMVQEGHEVACLLVNCVHENGKLSART